MADDKDVYSFYKITDIDLPLQIRISTLVGKLHKRSRTELLEHPEYRFAGSQTSDFPDLYVECRLWSDNKPLSPSYRTAYKHFHKDWTWNESITFPWKLSELPLNAQIAFTIYDSAGPNKVDVVGGTTFRLFGKRGTLRKAQHRLYVHRGKGGDGQMQSETFSKVEAAQDEMGRLEKLIKKYRRGDIPPSDWLDKLANRKASQIYQAELEASPNMFLYIEMPQFELPVVFCELEPKPITLPPLHTSHGVGAGSATVAPAPASATAAGTFRRGPPIDARLFTISDPEIARDNPIEAKFRRMARNHRSDPLAQEMKPSADIRDQLNEIMAFPPTRVLSGDEMDLVWKFRFYLTRDPKGLTKFLKSVTWTDPAEATQATEVIMPKWQSPAIGDALELLGPGFKDARVRAYAVSVLEKANDSDLISYLLQLVQAIKFDNLASLSYSIRKDQTGGATEAADQGTNQATKDKSAGAKTDTVTEDTKPQRPTRSMRASSSMTISSIDQEGLAQFLIRRGVQNAELGNNFYWYLLVECEDKVQGKLFNAVKQKFLERLVADGPKGQKRKESLERQTKLMKTLAQWAIELRFSKETRPKKIERLRQMINDPKSGLSPTSAFFAGSSALDPANPTASAAAKPSAVVKGSGPITLPLDATVKVKGILAEQSTIFKSNQLPLLLHFVTASENDANALQGEGHNDTGTEDESAEDLGNSAAIAPSTYAVIFKNGDDLRQDQLVIQLFTLMDRLLRNENLDLKMTPYKVLATGSEDGMVQFVPESQSVNAILGQYGGSLLTFLRKHNPDDGDGTLGVKPQVLDNFVRSCAGYCVVTYLLEVGDRHLDNLLLSTDGHFFHVDFGYILGRDPKPYPPPIKVTKEMIDCMGGTSSPHYARWKNLCSNAFLSLRKSSNLILNLVALMVDSNVRDIQREPDRAVTRVQEKFCLGMKDADAIRHLDRLLSEGSFISTLVDRAHDLAQMMRT